MWYSIWKEELISVKDHPWIAKSRTMNACLWADFGKLSLDWLASAWAQVEVPVPEVLVY